MSIRYRKRLIWVAFTVGFLTYAISYLVVTQRKYEQFRAWNARGFWYVSWENETSDSWERIERIAAIVYSPLHTIECDLLGYGMPHAACSPFFRLAK